MARTSALDSIDFAPAAVDELVIVSHGLPQGLVGHELLLHGEEIVELLDLRLGDDRPERLARDIGEQRRGSSPICFRAVEMLRNFSIIWRTFPGLQFRTSRITYMASLLLVPVVVAGQSAIRPGPVAVHIRADLPPCSAPPSWSKRKWMPP